MADSPVASSKIERTSLLKRLQFLAYALIVIIAFKYIASDLIAPILLAAMFAVLLMPIYYLYRRRGISNSISVLLMVGTVLLGTVGLILLLHFSFSLLRESLAVAVESVGGFTDDNSVWAALNVQAAQAAEKIITPQVLFSILDRLLANLSGIFLYFIIIPVLSVLLVSQIDSFSQNFKKELEKSGPSLDKYRKFAQSVNNYIVARFKVNLSTALMLTPILMLLGVDYAILWGLLTVVLVFIPYIGIYIAGVGPFLIMFANGGIPGVLLLAVVYSVVTAINENFVDPLVQGKQNRLTTASLLIGFIFWSWLFGVFGAIVSAPLTVMLKTILEDYKETQWIAMLMVGDYSNTPRSKDTFGKMFTTLRKRLPSL